MEARTEKEVSKAKGDIRRQLIAVPQKAMANSEWSFFRILTFIMIIARIIPAKSPEEIPMKWPSENSRPSNPPFGRITR